MQIHIVKAYEIIESHLPFNYVKLTSEKLIEKKIKASPCIIRNVKIKRTQRLDVLNALVEVALDNQKLIKSLEKLTA